MQVQIMRHNNRSHQANRLRQTALRDSGHEGAVEHFDWIRMNYEEVYEETCGHGGDE